MQELLMFLGGVMGQGRERNRLRRCRFVTCIAAGMENT